MHVTAKKNRRFSDTLSLHFYLAETTRVDQRERDRRDLRANVLGRAFTQRSSRLPMQTDMFNPKRTRGGKLLGTNLLVSTRLLVKNVECF